MRIGAGLGVRVCVEICFLEALLVALLGSPSHSVVNFSEMISENHKVLHSGFYIVSMIFSIHSNLIVTVTLFMGDLCLCQ